MKVLYLNSNKMGEGDPELGKKLLLIFLEKVYNTIDIDVIVCVNSAVYLTSSNVVEILRKFEAKGVTVSSCGTCLDFYSIREKLQVGNVGSMDLLVNLMNQAKKVIRP